jgi:RNA polymerase sigma factor (sigma-70 family)
MVGGTPRAVAGLVRQLASRQTAADPTDEELLRRFAAAGDVAAFELLFWRHERMVAGVCRRVLRDVHDAEDAVQATFLILAVKARSIGTRRALTTWLYTVAYRVALNARKERSRRQARVGPFPDRVDLPAAESSAPLEFEGYLDEAVSRLGEKYRGPVVLCCLEGWSHAEAARVLGCAPGTVASRLSRAKARLRAWLGRRGFSLSVGAIAAGLAAAGTPAATARTVAADVLQGAKAVHAGDNWPSAVSPRVSALTRGALRSMLRTKLLQALAVVLAALVVGGAGRYFPARQAPAAEPQTRRTSEPGRPEQPEKKTVRLDAFGDPLPEGAVARLGSLRLNQGNPIIRLVLSPDGSRAVAWSAMSNRQWDTRTGKEVPVGNDLWLATFFATRDRFVAVKQEQDGLVLWDATAGKQMGRIALPTGPGDSGALSADGKVLVWWPFLRRGGPASAKLAFVDTAAGTVRPSADAITKPVESAALSADGNVLALRYGGNSVDVWDVKTGKVVLSTTLKTDIQEYPDLSPDGTTLAAAVAGERQIRYWDVRTKKERPPLAIVNARSAGAVAYSPDGRFLAATYQGEVGLWDLAARTEVWRLKAKGGPLTHPAFSRDGKWLAAGDGPCVSIWDLSTGQPRHDFGHGYAIDALAFSPDGQTIVSGAAYTDNVVRVWDPLTGRIKGRWQGHRYGIEAVAYSPDGTLVASGSQDGTVRLWDAATGKEVGKLNGYDGMVYGMAFSPDGKTLAAGGKRKAVHFWDVATRREVRALDNPGELTVRIAYSPDGKLLATHGSNESVVRLWDVASGTEIRQVSNCKFGCPKFSSDNCTLAVNSDDSSVRLFDAATSRPVRSFVVAPGPGDGGCLTIEFAPDGRSLAAGYYDQATRLWEVASGGERARFAAEYGNVPLALAFSPDGSLLAVGGSDHTALIWDVFGLHTATRLKGKLTREDTDRLWIDLAAADAARAFAALRTLLAHGPEAVTLLNERLRPAAPADREKISRLIAALDDEKFTVRDDATAKLRESGGAAEPALRAALNGKPSPEKRRRLEELLQRCDASAPLLREVRAVEALERIGTPEARGVLQTLAAGTADTRLTREAKASLQRLTK